MRTSRASSSIEGGLSCISRSRSRARHRRRNPSCLSSIDVGPIIPCQPKGRRLRHMAITYVAMTSIDARMLDRELKKGSAELIILSIVEPRARHGYEISRLIESRSGGQLKFHVASLY